MIFMNNSAFFMNDLTGEYCGIMKKAVFLLRLGG